MMISKPSLSSTAIFAIQQLKPLGFVTGMTCAMCLTLYFFVLVPAKTQHEQTLTNYHTIKNHYEQHQSSRKTQEKLQAIWNKLPAKNELTGLGVTIVKLAKDNQVEIPGMGYHIEPTENGIASKGALAFEAAGDYNAIRRFIYKVETSPHHLFIEKLTAQRSKPVNRVAFKMTVGTFFKPNKLTSYTP